MMKRLALGTLIAFMAFAAWLRLGPIDESLLDVNRHQSLTVFDRNGEVLFEPLASTGNRAKWLSADKLPPRVLQATLAAEDRRFFKHVGVDPLATARAFAHNIRAMRVVEGGSTITQQVAKMLLASENRTFRQKMREALLAIRLEHRLSKRQILALYLN